MAQNILSTDSFVRKLKIKSKNKQTNPTKNNKQTKTKLASPLGGSNCVKSDCTWRQQQPQQSRVIYSGARTWRVMGSRWSPVSVSFLPKLLFLTQVVGTPIVWVTCFNSAGVWTAGCVHVTPQWEKCCAKKLSESCAARQLLSTGVEAFIIDHLSAYWIHPGPDK